MRSLISEFKEHRVVHPLFLCSFRIPSDDFMNKVFSGELQVTPRVGGFRVQDDIHVHGSWATEVHPMTFTTTTALVAVSHFSTQ